MIDPPAFPVTPVRFAQSVIVPGGNVPFVAVVTIVGFVLFTTEDSLASLQVPDTGALLSSPQ